MKITFNPATGPELHFTVEELADLISNTKIDPETKSLLIGLLEESIKKAPRVYNTVFEEKPKPKQAKPTKQGKLLKEEKAGVMSQEELMELCEDVSS